MLIIRQYNLIRMALIAYNVSQHLDWSIFVVGRILCFIINNINSVKINVFLSQILQIVFKWAVVLL